MISSTLLTIVILTLTNIACAQALNKAVVVPAVPSLDAALLRNLVPQKARIRSWPESWIPKDCKKAIEQEKLNPRDVDVFELLFNDCPNDPWVFCRHRNSPMQRKDMIETFGRMPVRVRQFVRHITAIPGVLSAGSSGDNIVVKGTGPNLMTIFIHEAAHSMDSHAVTTLPSPFHKTSEWLEAYNKDPAISDDYARTSQAENFAQTMVIAIVDTVVPGGFASIHPSYQKISNQYTTAKLYLGDLIVPYGKCAKRLKNSEAVPRVGGVTMRSFLQAGGDWRPDVGLSSTVGVIEDSEEEDTPVIFELWT
ncbi:hypothetical protein DFH27DRAFT_280189 [Peziza echinospora]|nr:hypothetical protein DFH27DRAFT_280189 [Peziza echinospora]